MKYVGLNLSRIKVLWNWALVQCLLLFLKFVWKWEIVGKLVGINPDPNR